MKKCVLSGYFGFKNFGDEAILSVLINKLRENNHNITVISSNPAYTISQYENVDSIYTFDIKEIIKTIYKSDVLISGGGSLLQDTTSFKSLIYYLFIILLGLIFRKIVIIFAQGIGPIKNPVGIFLTMLILKHCKYVSVRDKSSCELLKKLGINADLVCDPIFSMKIQKNADKNKHVAIQLRKCKGISMDFINRLAQCVCTYFPGYTIDLYSFQDEIDTEICKIFEQNLQMLEPDINTHIYTNLSNNEIIDKISQSEYLIAMRFHAIIVGLLSGVKTLSINYDIKVEKLSKEFKLPMINFNDDIKHQFENLKKLNPQYSQNLAAQKEFDWSCFDTVLNWE